MTFMRIDEKEGCGCPEDQLWIHDLDMQERTTQAEADFREGRSTKVKTIEEAQEFLNTLEGS